MCIRDRYNPFRVGYAKKIIDSLKIKAERITLLEVGCGGGILSEEFAKMVFITSGIDPAEHSLESARTHAKENHLDIKYEYGTGENIPYPDNSFNVVIC